MELFHAHNQWASRPRDEQFDSLQSLYDITKAYASTAREFADVRVDSLRVEAFDGAVQLMGKGGRPAALTHWSFGQLASRVDAPASYLRGLPATLAAQNLNHGLAKRVVDNDQATASLLVHANGGMLLRAMTSERYTRVWNWEVAERLLALAERGWKPAMPTFNKSENDRAPLYASDHDMFAFVVHDDRVIKEEGNPDGLLRGLIASNSEVGASSLRLTRFLYRAMCGNHIIWGAEDVVEMRAAHVGRVRERFDGWQVELTKYLDASASVDEARVARAKSRVIAATKDELLDALFGLKTGLTRKAIEAGYDAVVPDQDGNPLTAWGIAQGLTRSSQASLYADERTKIDRAAGRILEAF